ncbi:MAG TPA: Dabb family protein [Microlunatus sp.]
MIEHTVSFALVHPEASAEEGAFLDNAQRVLSAIPGVEDFTVSRQVSPKSDHRFRFSMRFADRAAYAAYDGNPAHADFVANRWAAEVRSFQELDLVPYAPS